MLVVVVLWHIGCFCQHSATLIIKTVNHQISRVVFPKRSQGQSSSWSDHEMSHGVTSQSHTSINKRGKWDGTFHGITLGVNWIAFRLGGRENVCDIKKKSFFQSRLRETPTHIPVHPKSADRCSCWHKQQHVHSEENYIDLIHLTGPLRYLVIGRLSWSFILWAELQQLPASIKK